MDQSNLLRHYADIDRIAPQVSILVQPKSIIEMTDQSDVTLETHIRYLCGDTAALEITSTGTVPPIPTDMATEVATFPRLRSSFRRRIIRRELPNQSECNDLKLRMGAG